MTALLSLLARPLLAPEPAMRPSLLAGCRRSIARYFACREALARLSEFDDAELEDIGLTRSEIGPAVRGRSRRG